MPKSNLDIGSIWRVMGGQNMNNMSPSVAAQMAAQASPDGTPLYLENLDQQVPPPGEMAPPQEPPFFLDKARSQPAIVPVPNPQANPSMSSQPQGSPQQNGVQPQSSSPWLMMDPADNLERIISSKAFKNFNFAPNSKMSSELDKAERSYGEQQIAHQAEINKLKEGLARYANMNPGINFAPLAALSDSWFGGNLSKAAEQMAPETSTQKLKNLVEMQKEIAAAQGSIPKGQLDLIQSKLAQMGYMDQRKLNAEIAKLNAAAKVAAPMGNQYFQGKRLELQEKRLDQQMGKEARGSVNNDPLLKQFSPRLEGAAKIGELIQSANEGKVVSNQALLGQLNAEISRLETGSQSPGLHASEKTELLSAKAQFGALKDRITGKPSDAVEPEVLDAARKLVNELSTSYMRGIDSRFQTLRAGMTPDQATIVDKKHAVLKETYGPRFGGWRGLDEMSKGGAPAIDADLSKMTAEQLQQYIQTHGGR